MLLRLRTPSIISRIRIYILLIITPLTLSANNFEQHISSHLHSRGLKVDQVKNNYAENDTLLFACVVNFQGRYSQTIKLKRMIEQGILSISRFYPGANILISYGEIGTKPNLTLPREIKVDVEEFETKSFNEDGKYTSYGRMKAYAEIIKFEERKSRPRGIIFYDADMLFVGSHFKKIFLDFKREWAVGLSFRKMEKFPINCGLMLVNHNNLRKGLKFWEKILSYYGEGSQFRGKAIRRNDAVADQLATCKVIESLGKYYLKQREHVRKLNSMNNTAILLLPTKRWNWTPKPMCYIDSRCAVLHFKGNKKVHMTKASKLLFSAADNERNIFLRKIAELGRNPNNSRHSLKKDCSD